MHQTLDIKAPNVSFLPVKLAYETIRVHEADFRNSQHTPPFDVIYFQLAAGDSTPKDRHDDVEIWIVLSGNGRLIYDDQESLLRTHDIVHFAPNRFHQVFNEGQDALLICSLSWKKNIQ